MKIKFCEAALKSYFAKIQGIYDLGVSMVSEEQETQLLVSTSNLPTLRAEFIAKLEEWNMTQMEADPKYEPCFQKWEAFETIYERVQNQVSLLQGKKNIKVSQIDSKAPQIKLPPIKLPQLDNDKKAWPMFIECFNSTIHNNNQLTNSEKVYYLCGQLSGKALEAIAGISPTGDNYELIYNTLVDKYQDVRSLATAYLDEIFNLKKMQVPSVDGLNSFIDKFSVSVAAFEKLDIISKLDFIYLYLALKKVDCDTAQLFENSVRSEQIPLYSNFVKFVKEQVKILERTGSGSSASERGSFKSNNARVPMTSKSVPVPGRNTKTFVTASDGAVCPLCNAASHGYFSKCTEFLKLSARERYNIAKKYNACVNCLSVNHRSPACNSKYGCSVCQSKTHHTLLHFQSDKSSTSLPVSSAGHSSDSNPKLLEVSDAGLDGLSNAGVSLCSMHNAKAHNPLHAVPPSTVLLATAKVQVVDPFGVSHVVRCLIDNGSQNHFITSRCCERLSLLLHQPETPISVHGFGGGVNRVQGVTELQFSSRFDLNEVFRIQPLVVNNITNSLPTSSIDMSVMSYLASVPLADDTFQVPGEVELLIGAQLFARLLLPGRVHGPPGTPDAIQTRLGFIIMGEAPALTTHKSSRTDTYCTFVDSQMREEVSKFWQLEEVPSSTSARLSRDEQECESIYKSSTSRDSTGRYTVALPFKSYPIELGSSLNTAQKRFFALERKLQASPPLRKAYDDVIKEYLEVGYLTLVSNIDDSGHDHGYVIPHHCVIRDNKVTTKLRIVLDASARTDRDISLNEVLHAGPNLQGDIFTLLLNFRLFAVAFCADVKQMYLQIKVLPEHCKYLRLLYRFNPNDQLQLFQFDRVCFGLTSSPFLALRTIEQLCKDEHVNFPLAVQAVNKGLYMDDVIFSVNSVSNATETVFQLIRLFKAGGFDLMKWSSNSAELLAQIPDTHLHPQVHNFDDDGHKILGVKWDPRLDGFSFDVSPCPDDCTKRNVLSVVARLWDVLGFAAPVILYAKLLIRDLWELKIDWDEAPPAHIVDKWARFKAELPLLTQLFIPRHIGVVDNGVVTLVACSDASEKAFGAAIYMHCQTHDEIKVNLLCAKSRVAPLKTVSLARLELCAVLLMSKLVRIVLDNYDSRCQIDRIVALTDSTVTLHWIHSSPHKWKSFVANRVAKIHENLPPSHFYHISTKENPSDCLSRGLNPAQLLKHPLWFSGPSWLKKESSQWPIQPFKTDADMAVPEAKTVSLAVIEPFTSPLYMLSQRVSSWPKLLRITVYVLRFVRKLSSKGIPNTKDLGQAELAIIRSLQSVHFSEAMSAVLTGKPCSKSIQKLRPFIVSGILRVGGRLEKTDLTFDHKHPILLPQKDHVVNIIIDHTHRMNCHAGPNLLLSLLRQRFWILAGRNLVRSRVHLCNACFRVRPKACIPPVMADLPECRLQMSKPFAQTGMDLCGPINITLTRKRGVKSQKAYICVFLCLSTRAAHVELIPDLSTDAFLNALKRFLGRRGPVEKLFSDNGTNFVGARSYLNELHAFLNSEQHKKQWDGELSSQRIEFEMIPPNSPHFGGGWESLVKGFKTHLLRSIGAQILTYEELLTVLIQIEAVLNSRPLGQALSPDPSEPVALTPAHFLHTVPLRSLPSAPVLDSVERLRSRFLLIDKLVQTYWNRWSTEYLNTLQAREKWLVDPNPIQKGTVVLIMQNNAPPLHWPLGIIQETYPGSDRRTRVVLVKTKGGTLKRPVVRLCPLPSQ